MIAIVVVDRSWAIGKDGALLFSLPADLRRFRSITQGGTVLMGRKTLESFPGGKPLPKRRNIVLTSGHLEREGIEVVHSPDELRRAAAQEPQDRVFVIGGGSVYRALLPWCERVLVTKVDAQADSPDTFFPDLDALPEWRIESVGEPVTENGVTYRFVDYGNQSVRTGRSGF